MEKPDGHLLAQQYCTTCHQFTEPDLLPKQSWEFLLTYMGFFLGVVDYSYLEGSSERTMGIIEAREGFVRAAKLLPDQPLISDKQWQALRTYYISNAPEESIPQLPKPIIVEDSSMFAVKPAQYRAEAAIISLVYIDETNGLLLIGDSRAEQFTVLDGDLEFHDRHSAPGVFLVEAEAKNDELYLLNIGDLFAANIGEGFGELQHAKLLGGVYFKLKILLKGLHRPSDFTFADLNNDGVEELLVSSFGDYTGNISIYKRDTDHGGFLPEPQMLSAEPGIVKSEVHDFNEDGLLDIVVLMSAARENVSIFLNQGDGGFLQKIILEQHPSFGYTGLELRDFNDDGLMDLMTLNGDNGDSDPYNTLKRDQGIRIYLNQGDLQFEESYFYPMYGVYGAEVEDFDLDGDLDIAAIAFHPDFYPEKPENFVYLEQTGLLAFAPKTHPATYNGRWLTMDSGDIDSDGDKDIVLGAGYSPVGMMANHQEKFLKLVKEGPPILVLENRLKN
ncbi:MAG: VCBS repeat-containing protein [Verrucomicrobia bacterium]|nr:VCBS repeat-containing protein [Verrucomicrobiota bacterium]